MDAPVICSDDETAMKAAAAIPSPASPRHRPVISLRFKLLGLAVLSGIMLFLCHFPVAWGWLGWVALVPLLPLVRAETSGKWRYFCAWLAGSVYFWPVISWMTVADTSMIACWAMLSFYCSLYFPLGIFLVRRLDCGTRLPLVLTLPVVWTALEYFRAFFSTGFSWYLLGHTQHNVLPVIQIADVGGAFAVSFLVAAVNALVFEGLTRLVPHRQSCNTVDSQQSPCCRGLAVQLLFVAVLLGGTLGYGGWCLTHDEFEAGPRIAVLQGNIDQRLRIDASRSIAAQAKVRDAYMELCRQASRLSPQPQLIVWPETSYPCIWFVPAPDIDMAKKPIEFQNKLGNAQDVVRMVGWVAQTNVLVGLNTAMLNQDGETIMRRFNSALLVDKRGEAVKRYDKIHRVPFGEYVPLRDWLPFMNRFSPYDFDYSISCGDGLTRFTLGDYCFGVLVCYEDTDPFMARDYGVATADGPAVDFLLNISNDGWFDGSSEHEEHLAISRFRAIETRRAVARSVNMGISAVIDGSGRVVAPVKKVTSGVDQREVWAIPTGAEGSTALAPGDWAEYKKTEGILVFDMPIDRRVSLYSTCGDWLPNGCWLVIGGGLTWGWRRRKRVK